MGHGTSHNVDFGKSLSTEEPYWKRAPARLLQVADLWIGSLQSPEGGEKDKAPLLALLSADHLGREPQNWIKTRQRVSPGAVECWLAFHNLPTWLGLVASKYSCHYRKMGIARITIRTWMNLCSLCPIRMSAKKTLDDFLHIQMTSPSLFPVSIPKCWLQMAGSEILWPLRWKGGNTETQNSFAWFCQK